MVVAQMSFWCTWLALLPLGLLYVLLVGSLIGCIVDPIPPKPMTAAEWLAAAGCYQKGRALMSFATTCEDEEALLRALLQTDRDCIVATRGNASYDHGCSFQVAAPPRVVLDERARPR